MSLIVFSVYLGQLGRYDTILVAGTAALYADTAGTRRRGVGIAGMWVIVLASRVSGCLFGHTNP